MRGTAVMILFDDRTMERRCNFFAVATIVVLTACGHALAQQAPAVQESLDAIIGTEVQEEEAQASADPARVIAAIEKTAENTSTVRKTSICGLGQVALGPVLSVIGMDRGGAAAREHPKDREDTEK